MPRQPGWNREEVVTRTVKTLDEFHKLSDATSTWLDVCIPNKPLLTVEVWTGTKVSASFVAVRLPRLLIPKTKHIGVGDMKSSAMQYMHLKPTDRVLIANKPTIPQ